MLKNSTTPVAVLFLPLFNFFVLRLFPSFAKWARLWRTSIKLHGTCKCAPISAFLGNVREPLWIFPKSRLSLRQAGLQLLQFPSKRQAKCLPSIICSSLLLFLGVYYELLEGFSNAMSALSRHEKQPVELLLFQHCCQVAVVDLAHLLRRVDLVRNEYAGDGLVILQAAYVHVDEVFPLASPDQT